MTEENSEPEALEEALRQAKESISPPDDPDELDPDYPPDYTPKERVEHVLRGEYPTWRSHAWIAAAAETNPDVCWSVIRERLAAGEVEISDEGIRRNRYHVYFEQVRDLTETVTERPRWL